MIQFLEVDVYNWHNAIRGMRNSYGDWDDLGWDKMDSRYDIPENPVIDPRTGRVIGMKWVFGPKDYDLALRLSKAGSSHAKYLRQILVSVDIVAGSEFWKEFDTYKVGTVANSTSMMHTLGRRLLRPKDFSFDDPEDSYILDVLSIVNEAIQDWWNSGKKIGTYFWRRMQKLIPMGFIYRRTVTLNYQVLKAMYHDRKGHRLREWRDFCAWVETLPYSQLITLKDA